MKTMLIMAGGTGGHVMPALAVAKELHARGVHVVWMGTAWGIEHELVPAAGFELKLVHVKGLRGTGLARKLAAPFVLLGAALQALFIILSSRANAILGMGGYVSGPGGMVGWVLRRPLILHEQNAVAGTTNRLLAPFASRIMTGFENVAGLAEDAEHIGNPVRSEILAIDEPRKRLAGKRDEFRILIIGGSQGAQVFNQHLPELLSRLKHDLSGDMRIGIVHQCGRNNQEVVEEAYALNGMHAEVREFISDMAQAYTDCDLVICRAGAMTVAEVAAAGVVALFVPLPGAIDDHQFYNAMALVDEDGALCYRQDYFLTGEWLSAVEKLILDPEALIVMAEKARSLAMPLATQRAADICEEVLDA